MEFFTLRSMDDKSGNRKLEIDMDDYGAYLAVTPVQR
jgi:hypothetical protein